MDDSEAQMNPELETLVEKVLSFEDQLRGTENEIEGITQKQTKQIEHYNLEIDKLREEINKVAEPYIEFLNILNDEIQLKKSEIADILTTSDKKTIDLDIAKVQMKTTKSVNVIDKKALIRLLEVVPDGIDKGVKTFALPFIRKLMEAEAVPDDVASFEENRKVYITRQEG